MTLRVTLEIVPFGNEDNKRTIYELEIWNMGSKTKGGKSRYQCDVIRDGAPFVPEGGVIRLAHMREHGAPRLVRRVLQRLEPSGRYHPGQN